MDQTISSWDWNDGSACDGGIMAAYQCLSTKENKASRGRSRAQGIGIEHHETDFSHISF